MPFEQQVRAMMVPVFSSSVVALRVIVGSGGGLAVPTVENSVCS